MTDIKALLTKSIEAGASDIHINVGLRPVVRKNTELIELELDVISEEDARQMVLSMVGQDRFKKFEENNHDKARCHPRRNHVAFETDRF